MCVGVGGEGRKECVYGCVDEGVGVGVIVSVSVGVIAWARRAVCVGQPRLLK